MESECTTTSSTPPQGVTEGNPKSRQGRTSGPARRSTRGQWTAEEDEILTKAVHSFKGKNWKKIAEFFKDRTDVQCLHRWQKVLNPELVKGPWTKEEDEMIVQLIQKYGPKKWSTIARFLPGRIGKQCRERWHNHLNPAINKEAWTQEEELLLIRAHQIYGNRWAELTKFLPGRSDNGIKNHWHSSVKKKLDSYMSSGLLDQYQAMPLAPYDRNSFMQSTMDGSGCVSGQAEQEIEHGIMNMGQHFHPCENSHTNERAAYHPDQYYYPDLEDISVSISEASYDMEDCSQFPDHNVSASTSQDYQFDFQDLSDISLEMSHNTSELPMTYTKERKEAALGAPNCKSNIDVAAYTNTSETECCRVLFLDQESEGEGMESECTTTSSTPPPPPPQGITEGNPKSRQGRTSGPARRSTRGQWTAEEDEILTKAVHSFKGKNWKKIAEFFKDRTDVQCLHRWQKVLNPELVKGPWTKEEDEMIVQLIQKYGPKKWSTIARFLPGRIGKQCRERWHNHLNPAINKEAWTQEEELVLIRAHQIYGNRWAELTKFLPGRSDNGIKNHWHSSVKKKLDSYMSSGLLDQYQAMPLAPYDRNSFMQSTMDGSGCVSGQAEQEIEHGIMNMGQHFHPCENSHTNERAAYHPDQYYYPDLEDISVSISEASYDMEDCSQFPDHNVSASTSHDYQFDFQDLSDISLEMSHNTSELPMTYTKERKEAALGAPNSKRRVECWTSTIASLPPSNRRSLILPLEGDV
ncbi:hypothetical protein F2Q68_00022924, partial [Brassica cretica]